jgi:hypothetical protein
MHVHPAARSNAAASSIVDALCVGLSATSSIAAPTISSVTSPPSPTVSQSFLSLREAFCSTTLFAEIVWLLLDILRVSMDIGNGASFREKASI